MSTISKGLKITEAQTLKAIMQYLQARHVLAFRMNTLAMPTADGERFIKSGVKGMADVLAIITFQTRIPHMDFLDKGKLITFQKCLWIEVKSPIGKQSEFQKSFQAQVEAEGHRYIVARSIEDVESAL